jgi:hypothetical protein
MLPIEQFSYRDLLEIETLLNFRLGNHKKGTLGTSKFVTNWGVQAPHKPCFSVVKNLKNKQLFIFCKQTRLNIH